MQGKIRENIDPFNEATDDDIYRVLKEVKLDERINQMEHKLDTIVSESNNLFSVG